MKYQLRKDKKRIRFLYLGLFFGLMLLIPIYLVITRWSKTVAGMDVVYIFLCSLTILILYFFPQLLFWQTVQIDADNIYVRRSGFLPDRLVFPKREVAYTRLDRKDGTLLTQQWTDPDLKDGVAIAFVLKNGMKVTSDKMYLDPEDFAEYKKILPNFVAAEETKCHHTSSGKNVHVKHTRYFIFAVFGIAMLFAVYIAYKVTFSNGTIW